VTVARPSAPIVGEPAPEFRLPTAPGARVGLAELRGDPAVLAFYTADFDPVSSRQISLYQATLPEFREVGARLLGISVDGVWCHQAFAESHAIEFPLLADFEPKGAVARRYGVYDEEGGASSTALFVLDPEGVLIWSQAWPAGVAPGADGILAALGAIDMVRVSA
jgi:peroxiredoxin